MPTAADKNESDGKRHYGLLAHALRHARGSDQAKAAAKAFIGKPLTNAETGIRAVISKTSFGKILSKSAVDGSVSQQAHHQAAANADVLFEIAIHRLSRPDRKGDINIKAVHHFDTLMPFDEQVLRVKLFVKEFTTPTHGNILYPLSAVEIEKPPLPKIGDMVSIPSAEGSGPTSLGGFAGKLPKSSAAWKSLPPHLQKKCLRPNTIATAEPAH